MPSGIATWKVRKNAKMEDKIRLAELIHQLFQHGTTQAVHKDVCIPTSTHNQGSHQNAPGLAVDQGGQERFI
jgi:hypothetical protein